MARVLFVAMMLGTMVFVVSGCPDMGSQDTGMTKAEPTAASLFTMITETDPYQSWAQFPGLEGVIDSAAPHGPMARVFINSKVEEALTRFNGRLGDGAIIIKENIGSSTSDKAATLNIMWKVDGFNPDNNDWFWVNITPAGTVNAEGKIGVCMSCHSGARANDFVFLHQF